MEAWVPSGFDAPGVVQTCRRASGVCRSVVVGRFCVILRRTNRGSGRSSLRRRRLSRIWAEECVASYRPAAGGIRRSIGGSASSKALLSPDEANVRKRRRFSVPPTVRGAIWRSLGRANLSGRKRYFRQPAVASPDFAIRMVRSRVFRCISLEHDLKKTGRFVAKHSSQMRQSVG